MKLTPVRASKLISVCHLSLLLGSLPLGRAGLNSLFFVIACGLYYLAELVEEYTVLTKKIIKGLTLVRARTRQATYVHMNQDIYQYQDIGDFLQPGDYFARMVQTRG